MSRAFRPGAPRNGVAALEFAIVLPLLLTLVLGGVDYGRFAQTQIAVNSAARAGAGWGSVQPVTPATLGAWQAAVRQAVVDEMSGLTDFDAARLTVTAALVCDAGGAAQAQVTVSYPFQTLVSWPGLPDSTELRQVVAMRCTRP